MNAMHRLAFCAALAVLFLADAWAASQRSAPPRFRASVDQIVVFASVVDERGQLVSGLTRDEFRIYEDRVEQDVTSFAQTEVPSTIGLVIDTSGSMRNKIQQVEQAVGLFLDQNNPQNELFLIRFDHRVEQVEGFTPEVEDIRDAVGNLIPRGGTALWDALYLSVEEAAAGNEPKKVIILFTDGEDKDSFYRQDEAVAKVQESEVQVFVVAFLDEDLNERGGFFGLFRSERDKVQKSLTEVAEVTGGRTFFPQRIDELDSVFEEIAHELKNQYRISYVSSNSSRDGEWRRIDVQLDAAREKGYKVRARKGYYAVGGDAPTASQPPPTDSPATGIP